MFPSPIFRRRVRDEVSDHSMAKQYNKLKIKETHPSSLS
jgi:hypothetical protein